MDDSLWAAIAGQLRAKIENNSGCRRSYQELIIRFPRSHVEGVQSRFGTIVTAIDWLSKDIQMRQVLFDDLTQTQTPHRLLWFQQLSVITWARLCDLKESQEAPLEALFHFSKYKHNTTKPEPTRQSNYSWCAVIHNLAASVGFVFNEHAPLFILFSGSVFVLSFPHDGGCYSNRQSLFETQWSQMMWLPYRSLESIKGCCGCHSFSADHLDHKTGWTQMLLLCDFWKVCLG